VVQKGDYLVALGRKFGVPWQTLASLNGIGYPYIIYPGQVLKIP
jgi:LysM repeat protein